MNSWISYWYFFCCYFIIICCMVKARLDMHIPVDCQLNQLWSQISFAHVQVIETFLSKGVNYVISSSAPPRSSSQTRGQGQGEGLGPESPSFAGSPSPFSTTPSPTYKNVDGKIVPVRGLPSEFFSWGECCFHFPVTVKANVTSQCICNAVIT